MEFGTYLVVKYNVPGVLYHERLVIGVSRQAGWRAIATPDDDLYMEQYSGVNDDIEVFRVLPHQGAAVHGVAANRVYRFAGPVAAARLEDLRLQGRALVEVHDAGLPLLPAPGAGAIVPAGAAAAGAIVPAGAVGAIVPAGAAAVPRYPVAAERPAVSPPGGAYLLDEPLGGHDVGEVFLLGQGAQILHGRALAEVDGQPASFTFLGPGASFDEWIGARCDLLACDRRTLPSRKKNEGIRTFATLVGEMEEIEDPGGKMPLQGPATASWVLRTVSGQGTDMIVRHHRWVHESGVRPGSPAIHEHEVLSNIVQHAVVHDRLNAMNLACLELALRRMQLHESAIGECAESPSYEGARFFLGTLERRGGALIAPTLSAHVATELGREAAIQKEKRKAREAKAAAAKGKAAPKTPAPAT